MTETPGWALGRALLILTFGAIGHGAAGQEVPGLKLDGVPPPRFPPIAMQAGIGGRVSLQFILDSSGRVTRESITFLQDQGTRSRMFEEPVTEYLTGHTFRPVQQQGIPTSTTVLLTVEFLRRPVDSGPQFPVWTEQRTDAGLQWRIGWDPVTRVVPAPILGPADALAALRAILLAVPVPTTHDSMRVLCIQQAPAELLDRTTLATLQRGRRLISPPLRCPRTYASWILTPSGDPRPRGALDPDFIQLTPADVWTPDVIRVEIWTGRGFGGLIFRCDAMRDPQQAELWIASCDLRGHWMS